MSTDTKKFNLECHPVSTGFALNLFKNNFYY